jgi:hypothetical protein
LSQCSLAKVAIDAVGRIDVVMTVMPLVLKMECVVVSFLRVHILCRTTQLIIELPIFENVCWEQKL